ncbi:hypothetical protein D3Z60_23540 [Lachnospiraceae bacterium]|nr:hypothetical protein [Lachnospiraceae bacterium]
MGHFPTSKIPTSPQGGKWEFAGIGYPIPMLAILPPITYYGKKSKNGNLLGKFLKIIKRKEGKPIFLWLSLLADP